VRIKDHIKTNYMFFNGGLEGVPEGWNNGGLEGVPEGWNNGGLEGVPKGWNNPFLSFVREWCLKQDNIAHF
jgi:hypothetical protein